MSSQPDCGIQNWIEKIGGMGASTMLSGRQLDAVEVEETSSKLNAEAKY